MAKTDSWENQLLAYIFNKTAIPWDAATNLFLSGHTASPGEAGSQLTSECNYTSYTRVTISRSSTDFTISASTLSNAKTFSFPACTGGTNTLSHIGIGTSFSGTGTLIYYGTVSSPSGGLAVSSGITPSVNPSQMTLTED